MIFLALMLSLLIIPFSYAMEENPLIKSNFIRDQRRLRDEENARMTSLKRMLCIATEENRLIEEMRHRNLSLWFMQTYQEYEEILNNEEEVANIIEATYNRLKELYPDKTHTREAISCYLPGIGVNFWRIKELSEKNF